MKSRFVKIPALGLALTAILAAGCSKGGGGSSGGSSSSSSKSSSSGGAGSPTGGTNAPPSSGGGGGGTTAPAGPPPPNLGYAYHTAVFAYYYFYHKKDTVIWGDVGAQWGHYDQDDYSSPLEPGYDELFPDFEEATLFGSYYDRGTLPPPPPVFDHDPYPLPPLSPDGIMSYDDILIDATACYTSLLDTVSYTPTATYTGDYIGTTTYTSVDVYEQDLADLSPGNPPLPPGKYHFTGNASLNNATLTLSGDADDVWIFQIEGNLYVRGAAKVVLTGGAVAQNVWWQVGVEVTSGEYVDYDETTGHYIYNFIPGAYIGDDPSYPPYNDPATTGHAAFQGNVLVWGDVAVGRGSSLTGRAFSLYYGWWNYAAVVYGSVTINATQPLPMGTANDFAILAHTDVVNTGETSVKGRVGVSTGTSHGSDPLEVDPVEFWLADSAPESDAAIASASTARSLASARDLDYDLSGQKLQGKTLPPGVYQIDSAAFTGSVETDGPVTLEGLNDPSSVWIFRMSGALNISATDGILQFIYANGANPDNVFWICTTCTIAPSVSFRGTILADSPSASAIYLDSDATVQGRVVATAGSIQLNSNTVFSNSSGGQLVWTQTINPPGGANDEAVSVVHDLTSLYVFGFENGSGPGSDSKWRLEKRDLVTGALDPTFNAPNGFITWNPDLGNDIPRRILIDGTGLYLFGSQESPPGSGTYQWRLEKRSLTTGLPDATFGAGFPILTLPADMPLGGLAGDMALDGSTLYLTGDMNDSAPFASTRIRIEKRLSTTGALDTSNLDFRSPASWYSVPTLTVSTDPGWVSPGAAGPTTIHPSIWVPAYPGSPSEVDIEGAAWYSVPTWVEPVAEPYPPGYFFPGSAGWTLTTVPPSAWNPPYLGDPALVMVRAATPVGVIVDEAILPRGALCITVVPVPTDVGGLGPYSPKPFLIVGGWQASGPITSALYQKRFATDGSLDIGRLGLGEPIPYPGYGLSTGLSTEIITWGGASNAVQSIANDGEFTYALLSTDYVGLGVSHWVIEKRTMMGFVPLTYPSPGPTTGGSPDAEPHYALGIYGPAPFAPFVSDFSCSSLCLDPTTKRFFIAGCNTGELGGELWRMEKRKAKTLVFDALFNTNGERPGMIENDPDSGRVAVLPQWYVYNTSTYSAFWSTVDPETDGDSSTIWYPLYVYPYTPDPAYYRAGSPAVAGRPDRCRAVTFHLDKIYVVGGDSTDLPSHLGQWRIEARNK